MGIQTDKQTVLSWNEDQQPHQELEANDYLLLTMDTDDITEDGCDIGPLVISTYLFWQDGFLLCMLLLGLVCLCHVAVYRVNYCKNAYIVAMVISAGLGHILSSLYILDSFKTDLTYRLSRDSEPQIIFSFSQDSKPECADYTFPALLSISVTLATLVHSMIQRYVTSSLTALVLDILVVVSMITGIVLIFKDGFAPSKTYNYAYVQETIISPSSDTDIVWSLCKKSVARERTRLVLEYGLLYSPTFILTLYCLCRSYKECKGILDVTLKITRDTCDVNSDCPCFCSKLNKLFVGVLGYSFLLLFIVRPAFLVYSSLTSGVYHDLLPGHLNIMVYFVMCIEYLISSVEIKR